MSDCLMIEGSCPGAIRCLEGGSIAHVVTDPPYGQTNEKYDKGVDPEVWRECYRVTGPDASLISFAGNPTYHRIASDIEAAGWKVRQMWAWVYRDGMITSAWPKEGFDRLAPAMDPIVYATKGKVLLSLEREGGAAWDRESSRSPGKRCGLSHRSGGHGAASARGRWPRNVVATEGIDGFQYFILSRSGRSPEKVGHPNQKPLALMRWLVSKLPDLGRPILDPFAGSGTTLDAARAEGFDAIGIECDPAYVCLAERRLAAGAVA